MPRIVLWDDSEIHTELSRSEHVVCGLLVLSFSALETWGQAGQETLRQAHGNKLMSIAYLLVCNFWHFFQKNHSCYRPRKRNGWVPWHSDPHFSLPQKTEACAFIMWQLHSYMGTKQRRRTIEEDVNTGKKAHCSLSLSTFCLLSFRKCMYFRLPFHPF